MQGLVSKSLGEYRVIEELGRGGFAAVYKAVDTTSGRIVALKVLAPHLTWDREFVARFRREASTVAELKHPNIVAIHEVGGVDGKHYIAMPYFEGDTLKELIQRKGALPFPRARGIANQLAEALDYAHSQGVVHRDIKPSNIFIGEEDHVTLSDFGIAKATDATRLTRTGTLMGTPGYMSPEQAKGEEIDWRTDIYSLGIVVYEMLTGRLPFQASTPHGILHAQIYEPPPPPRTLNPNLPLNVDRAVRKALAKKPDERYSTAAEFVQSLSATTGPAARKPATPPRLGARPLMRALAVPLAVVSLIVLAIIVGAVLVRVGGGGTPIAMGTATATGSSRTAVAPIATADSTNTPTRTATPIRTATRTARPTATGTPTPTPTWMPSFTPTPLLAMPTTGARVYVVSRSSGRVSILHAANGSVLSTIQVGNWPQGIVANPEGTRVYVANTGSDSISVIDVATSSVVTTIPVGDDPVIPAVSPDGRHVYVVNIMSSSVSIVDTSSNSVTGNISDVRYPWGIAVSPDGTRIAVTEYRHGFVTLYETSALSLVARIRVGQNPEGIIYHPNGSRIYVANLTSNSVSVIDTASNTVVATIPVERGPVQFSFSTDASKLYVANNYSASASEIDVSTNSVIRSLRADAGPIDVEIVGHYLYVTNHDADTISVIDLDSGLEIQTLRGFSGPHSMILLYQE